MGAGMGAAARAAGVAVVIVPRERFSFAERSLESVLAHTTHPHELIYVDGRSPARVGRYLKARAASADFRLIRTPHHLTPNEARNIGWRATSARYVVFVDNDVLVTPGWLEALVACADETGAWLVGPTSCIGEPTATLVHMAGGQAKIAVKDGRRVLVDEHGFENRRLDAVRSQMHRKPTGLIEFHTALVRREVFDRLGPLDEALRSTREHIDLSLAVQQAGGEIWFEPASVVTYVPPPPFRWFDVPYFLVRWSEAWNTASFSRCILAE